MKILTTYFKSLFVVIGCLVLFSACNASKRCGCPPVGDKQFQSVEQHCQLDAKELHETIN